jgi:tetratricopeptide (TPR) repeat protein
MAVTLEPTGWRHHLRLGYVSWGEERLREARRTWRCCPVFHSHWLAATVHVARQAFDDTERELTAGMTADASQPHRARFGGVALHWLHGLIVLARGDEGGALASFDRELAGEESGQLYARECCANAWYAIGAVRLRRGDRDGALAAFAETVARVPLHPMAHAASAALRGLGLADLAGMLAAPAASRLPVPELALARAIVAALAGRLDDAARVVDEALMSPERAVRSGCCLSSRCCGGRLAARAPARGRLSMRAA